jgi:hypothetical protein
LVEFHKYYTNYKNLANTLFWKAQHSGIEVFHHYMRRITQRGWGQFEVLDVTSETDAANRRQETERCGVPSTSAS